MPEAFDRDLPLGTLIKESFAGEWGLETPQLGFVRSRVVRSTEIHDDGSVALTTAVERFIPSEKVAGKSLQDGDIVIKSAGGSPARPVGRPAILRVEDLSSPIVSSNFVRTLRFDAEKVTQNFAIHALRRLYAQPRFGVTQQKTTGIINLNFGEFQKLKIWVPGTVDRQALIAEILDAVDDAILEADALIEKHEALRLGLLDDLIAVPAQVGRSDAADKLADVVASISSGCSVNADDRPPTAGEFGVLKTSSVGGGRFRPAESKAVWTREIGRLKCPVAAELILFSRMNTPQLVGENAFVEHDHPDLFLPDRLWAIRVKEDEGVLAAWVATILQTRQARGFITGEATGTSGSMKNIAQKSLLRLPIRKLPESDQADAVKAIAALQVEIDELTAERDKLADLRLGLRDDLLSGRKPVAASREAAE